MVLIHNVNPSHVLLTHTNSSRSSTKPARSYLIMCLSSYKIEKSKICLWTGIVRK